jgi:hypothetical protein
MFAVFSIIWGEEDGVVYFSNLQRTHFQNHFFSVEKIKEQVMGWFDDASSRRFLIGAERQLCPTKSNLVILRDASFFQNSVAEYFHKNCSFSVKRNKTAGFYFLGRRSSSCLNVL